MIAKYLAIPIGVIGFAMFGNVGFANAETKVPEGNQRVVLTDSQMEKMAAGHLYYHPGHLRQHTGWFWLKVERLFWPDTWKQVYGRHEGCGAKRCG